MPVVTSAYTAPGDYTWRPPAGVTLVREIRLWGAGGGGEQFVNPAAGRGGGGGAIVVLKNILVDASTAFPMHVGAKGRRGDTNGVPPSDSTDGEDTTIEINGTTYRAKGGLAGKNDGIGGQASASTGPTKYSGGNGAVGIEGNNGGGAGARITENGANGQNSPTSDASGSGGAGGPGAWNGGSGGSGAYAGATLQDGYAPGGGGGGGAEPPALTEAGGDGDNGAIIFYFDSPVVTVYRIFRANDSFVMPNGLVTIPGTPPLSWATAIGGGGGGKDGTP